LELMQGDRLPCFDVVASACERPSLSEERKRSASVAAWRDKD